MATGLLAGWKYLLLQQGNQGVFLGIALDTYCYDRRIFFKSLSAQA